MSTARLLVIEDNPANLELMTYLLRSFGHSTSAAISGEEGLSAACHDPPDLIICDVHLPGMDGCEVVRRLKTHPVTHDIPVVAVTALAMVGDRERILSSGFNAYIPKPIDPEMFVQQVESSLPAARHQRPSLGAGSPANSARILMVDDSPVDVVLARRILEPLGYLVTTAPDADQGLESARQHLPDLILSDVQVGCGKGLNLLQEIRTDACLKDTPFVFISSSDMRNAAWATGSPGGADGHLMRPLAPRALLSIVEGCLQERKRSHGDDTGH